jgi:integrase
MPKLKNQPPKYSKAGKHAVVYYLGRRIYLGLHGSPESKVAYARFVAENRIETDIYLPKGKESVTVKDLVLSFLDHVKGTIALQNYGRHRTVVKELLKLYGDDTSADNFTPSCLKLFRQELVNSKRLCRTMVNDYTRRVVFMFTWGVGEELVSPLTEAVLKAIKPLPAGYAGTFDYPEREDVPDDVIKRTLPFMPPTVAAMVKLQRYTGMRPSEVFNMRVEEIDKTTDPEFWLYRLPTHKTQKKTKRKKVLPLSKIEQELIAPFLEGKNSETAVFSPRTATIERMAEHRAKREKKLSPSLEARKKITDAKPPRGKEFYHKDTYRLAVEAAIAKANKTLPDKEKIPHWTPYQLRHSASSAMEVEEGIDEAQALLGHTTPNTTARYNHRQLQKLKELARNRRDVFGER